MILLVLHLSDIHIAAAADPVLTRTTLIARSLYPHLSGADAVLIIFSGDIAQSGLSSEYELAKKFIRQIEAHLNQEAPGLPVHIVTAPGNHDCDFSGDQETRLTVIGSIPKRPLLEIPGSFIATATEPQENYFAFRNQLEASSNCAIDDPLWRSHVISLGEFRVQVDCLNASWMSKIHEQQGGLLFPYLKFKDETSAGAAVRIGVLHHPFNWYSQMNYLDFRAFMHGLEDLIFTGHEHQSGGRVSDDASDGECIYIEGAALQSRSDFSSSGLNVVKLDLAGRKLKYIPHLLEGELYAPQPLKEEWQDYRAMPKRDPSRFSLTLSFARQLSDPGATLKHPSGIAVGIDDIYIYPDLDPKFDTADDRNKSRNLKKPSSRALLDFNALESDILLTGEEAAGKTQLLFRLFSSYHAKGFLPLYISGRDLKSSTEAEIDKVLAAAIRLQYGDSFSLSFLQEPTAKKVLLLDDFDEVAPKADSRATLLTRLRSKFSRMILAMGQEFLLAETLSGASSLRNLELKQYSILPLGYERRGELVRKWAAIGHSEAQTANDMLRTADELEKLIESARLQHVASTVPIYVLSLLQASASGLSKELHNSSFAHYYYFLVVGALEKGGVAPTAIGPYLTVCTHLSWSIKKTGDQQRITKGEYLSFIAEYSREWTETSPEELLATLAAAKLVEADGGYIHFRYPYAYYYFLGRYASLFIGESDVQQYLQFCVNNLYVRECANTLLFLAHHSGNSQVLDHVVDALRNHFPKSAPVSLGVGDVKVISRLIANAPRVKYKATSPIAYRSDSARQKDTEESGDGLADSPADERELFHEVVSLIKSLEIAGALLTHQYSNYQKVKKVEAIRQMFEGSLRSIRELYSYFEAAPDRLIEQIATRLKSAEGITEEAAVNLARHRIGLLLRALAAGFLSKAGAHLTADHLAGHVDEVMGSAPTPAYRLIRLAQKLQHPTRLPRADVERLIKDQRENPAVMGPLQLLVLQRLYMYDTDYDDKDWALAVFELGQSTGRALEYRNSSFQKPPKYLK